MIPEGSTVSNFTHAEPPFLKKKKHKELLCMFLE